MRERETKGEERRERQKKKDREGHTHTERDRQRGREKREKEREKSDMGSKSCKPRSSAAPRSCPSNFVIPPAQQGCACHHRLLFAP